MPRVMHSDVAQARASQGRPPRTLVEVVLVHRTAVRIGEHKVQRPGWAGELPSAQCRNYEWRRETNLVPA